VVAEALRTGQPAPAEVTLQPVSLPDITEIKPLR
jgi:hypothetical protein